MSTLPIASMPAELRRADPNLSVQPLYRLDGPEMSALVGDSSITFTVSGTYKGWSWFLPEILKNWKLVLDSKVPTGVNRIGLRYVDFFKADIFPLTRVRFQLGEQSLVGMETFLRTGIVWNEKKCILQIGKDVRLTSSAEIGSVIDSDVFEIFEQPGDQSVSSIEKFLDEAHAAGKHLFFSMLDPGFLAVLNPVYAQP